MTPDLQAELASLVPAAHVLLVLLLCALMGLLGQGVRAVVGLKNGGALNQSLPSRQSEFNAAYLAFSLMLGAIAGILAGLVIGPLNFNAGDIKTLLGIAASGYAGADFIENTYSILLSRSGRPADAKILKRRGEHPRRGNNCRPPEQSQHQCFIARRRYWPKPRRGRRPRRAGSGRDHRTVCGAEHGRSASEHQPLGRSVERRLHPIFDGHEQAHGGGGGAVPRRGGSVLSGDCRKPLLHDREPARSGVPERVSH